MIPGSCRLSVHKDRADQARGDCAKYQRWRLVQRYNAPVGFNPYIFHNNILYRSPIILTKLFEQSLRLPFHEIRIFDTFRDVEQRNGGFRRVEKQDAASACRKGAFDRIVSR
jgi:hypothetical protein